MDTDELDLDEYCELEVQTKEDKKHYLKKKIKELQLELKHLDD